MSILVTGAAGFIGAATTHKLLEGGASVVGLEASWDERDATLRQEIGGASTQVRSEADAYVRRRRAEAEAAEARLGAEAHLAASRAAALRDKLLAQALDGEAGRLYTAIQAARNFKVGELDPTLRTRLATMEAWRRFFLRTRVRTPRP